MSETTPRIFISYSRQDGKAFAAQLRAELEVADFSIWQDLIAMEGGRDWWQQITDALDQVEYMILVATPAAMQSSVVAKEWRYARQQGVCVYPVMLPDKKLHPDFKQMPRWMRKSHFYNHGEPEQRRKLLADLQGSCDAPRQPFMAGDMPLDYVQRPDEFNALVGQLIQREAGEPVAITTALRGAGGYGKTTLARALCHDDDVQEAFSNGVLWITLGERPGNLISHLVELIRELNPDAETSFTSQEGARAELRNILDGADVLLVVDDVWKREHLNPFLNLGDGVAVLVTTRNDAVLPSGIAKQEIDRMKSGEAVALLGAGLGNDVIQQHGAALGALADRLGEWPLLLGLVNGVLRRRIEQQTPAEAIAYVYKALAKRGLVAFDDRDATQRQFAVSKTLAVSFELLTNVELARYHELAIFPEDTDIPLVTVERLWHVTAGLDDFDTEELAEQLYRLSLLLDFSLQTRTLRLHDVIREYLRHEVKHKLPHWNERLLDSYGVKRWADLPQDEPYLWDQLAWHLVEAGREEALLATVKDAKYLCAKTLARDAHQAEGDMIAVQKYAADDRELTVIKRHFANSGHILNRCNEMQSALATLHSRISHIPELATIMECLYPEIRRPYIAPRHRLPDLPHPALIRTLSRHIWSVYCCAVSPNGKFIVSASDSPYSLSGCTLKVWDVYSGAERLTLKGHTRTITACAVSSDGSFIVSASSDLTLKVWDAYSGAERMTLVGHTSTVRDCAISSDGSFIVSASDDCTLKVWDSSTGTERLTLKGHRYSGRVIGCAVSPDGSFIVSASDDCTLKVWDSSTGTERMTLSGHTKSVYGCAVSRDGSFIVSASGSPYGSSDNTLKVWDAHSGTERLTLKGHSSDINSCAVSPDGSLIVSASADYTLKIWDSSTGTERTTFSGHTGIVWDCAVGPSGDFIVSASDDRTLKIWDVTSEIEYTSVQGHAADMNACTVNSTGTTIVSAGHDGTLKIWDAKSGTERMTLSGHVEAVFSCAISWDDSFIVSASKDGMLKIWDTNTGIEQIALSGHREWVHGCTVSRDGSFIVSASRDKTLKVWDAQSGDERMTLVGHEEPVFDCAVSSDGSFIVSGSWDNTLKVWNAQSGAECMNLIGHKNWILCCTVSPNGSFVVSASADYTLKVWDAQSGAERMTLVGHRSWVSGCSVSPNGQLIVSASHDKTLKVWDALSGACLTTFHVDTRLLCCAWSPDGETIVAGGEGGHVYFLRWVGP